MEDRMVDSSLKSLTNDGGGASLIKDHDLRLFKIGIDVRSFRANLRLQMHVVNIYIRVLMPQHLVNLAAESPLSRSLAKLTSPLRTHPPIVVRKGSEVSIPNGYVALELPAYVGSMALALVSKPNLLAQIFHSDRFTTDVLIGTASIPMSELMHKPFVDGYAPVFSLSSNTISKEAEQFIIGFLRVAISLDELGPIQSIQRRSRNLAKEVVSLEPKPWEIGNFPFFLERLKAECNSDTISARPIDQDKKEIILEKSFDDGEEKFDRQLFHPRIHKCFKEAMDDSFGQRKNSVDIPSKESKPCQEVEKKLHEHPTYDMAWEFETWKCSEEAKWRLELQDKEKRALDLLEKNWEKKEKDMVRQVQMIQEANVILEEKLRSKLIMLEKREKGLIMAEEFSSMRREALERNFAQRNVDIQVAVKRLQEECEHRLELGHLKYVALEDQYKVLEKRWRSTNASMISLESEFSKLKAAYRNTSEACLTAKVLVLQQQCTDLQQKLESLLLTRDKYREQVLRMAKELANLQHLRMYEEAKRKIEDQDQNGTRYPIIAVDAHAMRLEEERLECHNSRQQLESLERKRQKNDGNIEESVVAKTKSEVAGLVNKDFHSLQDESKNYQQRRETSTEPNLEQKNRSLHQECEQTKSTDCSQTPIIEIKGDQMEKIEANNGEDNLKNFLWDTSLIDLESSSRTSGLVDNLSIVEAQKLSLEKLSLLSSGVYTCSDPLIIGLDQEISKLSNGE